MVHAYASDLCLRLFAPMPTQLSCDNNLDQRACSDCRIVVNLTAVHVAVDQQMPDG
jgi:hypothetical protein